MISLFWQRLGRLSAGQGGRFYHCGPKSRRDRGRLRAPGN